MTATPDSTEGTMIVVVRWMTLGVYTFLAGSCHARLSVAIVSVTFSSGPTLTAKQMVAAVKKLARDWKYDVVSIGYPGLVVHGRPVLEPHHLGPGWVGCDFAAAFKRPVTVISDAALQALGSYKRGRCSSWAWEPAWAPP